MSINKEKTIAVKVYLSKDVHEALKVIADQQLCSLSFLIGQAAIDRHLVRARQRQRIVYRDISPSTPIPENKSSPKRPVQPPTFSKPSKMLISTQEGLGIDDLITRFNGDRSLKARLCQLGGRGDHLFKGSITHAEKVAEVTARLDPEGLPWFPLAPNRLRWLQISASDFVALCLTQTEHDVRSYDPS